MIKTTSARDPKAVNVAVASTGICAENLIPSVGFDFAQVARNKKILKNIISSKVLQMWTEQLL